ncbi:MAG: carbamoyltransferase C-terminal domain-containing protein [Desulfobacter sp.]
MSKYILGIHEGHNASVCLINDNQVIYATQEERHSNIKNHSGFPESSVEQALKYCGINKEDIDYVALAGHHIPNPDSVFRGLYKKQALRKGKAIVNLLMKSPIYNAYKATRKKKRIDTIADFGFNRKRIRFVEHHLCHASAAYFALPTPKDKKVLVLTLDGSGDGLCSTVNIALDGEINRIAATDKGDSVGNIYSRVTFLLGFKPWEHEYKLMGMAPYVSETGQDIGYEIFKNYIDIDFDNPLKFKRKISEPTTLIYKRLRRDTELVRFDNICAGLQKMTEDVVCRWVDTCIRKTGIETVALSGGVFMNVKVNKKIMELESVKDLYILPSCGDETNSIGAAYHVYHDEFNKKDGQVPTPLSSLYLGNDTENNQCLKAIEEYISRGYQLTYEKYDNIEIEIAKMIAERNVVARCNGRMEFGARALGNRSILADPSDLSLLNKINLSVKKRDFWMPFAPVILKERAGEYIKNPKNVESPHMILSFDTTDKYKEFLGGVHQADHTARAQVIEKEANPEYYTILKEFERITGRGVLLNTSFNLHGYPIVCQPEDALWVLVNSELNFLALGDYLVRC